MSQNYYMKDQVVDLCESIGATVRDPDKLRQTVTKTGNTSLLGWAPWSSTTLSAGFPSLILMSSQMEKFFPGDSWHNTTNQYLMALQEAMKQEGFAHTTAMFSGMTGIAFSIQTASAHTTRNRKFLSKINHMIISEVTRQCSTFRNRINGSRSPSDYDVISGLSGAGRYLLNLTGNDAYLAVDNITECLTNLARPTDDGKEGWYVPPEQLFTDDDRQEYPYGAYNCGVAHGLAGVVSFLSLAYSRGHCNARTYDAIQYMSQWLVRHSEERSSGFCWPTLLTLQEASTEGAVSSHQTRDAWCYGTAGIGRSLYLAGVALSDSQYLETSLEAFHAIEHRADHNLDGMTFCHGKSGLLHIVDRMYSDTHDEQLLPLRTRLLSDLIRSADSNYPFLIPDMEGTRPVNKIGLIDGISGVVLTLLAAIADDNYQSTWDQAFLVS